MLTGNCDNKISKELNISYATERAHIYNILSKNKCRSRDDLYMLYYSDLVIKIHITYLVKILQDRTKFLKINN